jgi:hypothetical protein
MNVNILFFSRYKWLETLFYLIIGVCPAISWFAMVSIEEDLAAHWQKVTVNSIEQTEIWFNGWKQGSNNLLSNEENIFSE